MLGAASALITALAWAISSIFLKLIADKIDTLSINTIRMWIGSAILIIIVFATGKYAVLTSIPLDSLAFVIVSGILAMAIGDTMYIKSLIYLDITIAFPIAQCSFVVMAVLAAIVMLDEPFTWVAITGSILVAAGIYLMTAFEKGTVGSNRKISVNRKGLIILFASVVAWTAAAITLKIGVLSMDPFVAASIRIVVSAIVLTALTMREREKGALQFRAYGIRALAYIAFAGIMTYGVAAVGYVFAIQLLGAGKTALLTAIAPLFALPFSIFVLKEQPTSYAIAGIFICVGGVCMVVL